MGIVIQIEAYREKDPIRKVLNIVSEELREEGEEIADEHEINEGIGAVSAFDVLEAWKVLFEAATKTRRHYLKDIQRSGAVVKAALLRKGGING